MSLALKIVIMFVLSFVACTKTPLPQPDLQIEIVRPRTLRCGTPSVDNVCLNDIAYIFAVSTKSLVVFRYNEIDRQDEMVLLCPGDPRCVSWGRGFFARIQFVKHGRVSVIATQGPATGRALEGPDYLFLDHRGKYKYVYVPMDVRL